MGPNEFFVAFGSIRKGVKTDIIVNRTLFRAELGGLGGMHRMFQAC